MQIEPKAVYYTSSLMLAIFLHACMEQLFQKFEEIGRQTPTFSDQNSEQFQSKPERLSIMAFQGSAACKYHCMMRT